MNINTNINMTYPIVVKKEGVDIEIGQLYASIGRQSNSINIQTFINNKELMTENIEEIRQKYKEFYSQLVQEAELYGFNFINIIGN